MGAQYTTEELEAKALKVIETEGVHFITDLTDFMGISRQTFYDHKLDSLDSIKDALNTQKRRIKRKLRQKWELENNPTLQVALYRLLATPEELDALTQSKNTFGSADGQEIKITIGKRNDKPRNPKSWRSI